MIYLIAFIVNVYLFYVFHKPYLQLRHKNGQLYLTRWALIDNKWFRIFIHRLDGPDPDRDSHNHPWDAFVFVLKGGYAQTVISPLWDDGIEWKQQIRWVNRLGADYHKITALTTKRVWTISFCGPVKRDWGFLVDGKHVYWETYVETHQKHFMVATGVEHVERR